jgi:hypothetical protein
MQKKPYDLLDHRKSEFDIDCREFKHLAVDILVRFMNRASYMLLVLTNGRT